MTRSKRILAISGGVLVLLLALLVILPLVFRDRIAARVKTEINQSVEAKVDWRDVGLGFFHDFPNLTLTLDDLTAVGVGRFEGDTLAAIGRFGVSLDLASVVRNVMGGSGPVVVRSIELDRPRLRLVKLKDGAANWDITKKTPEAAKDTAAAKPVAVSLRRFTITDANVAVDNRQAGLSASVFGYDQTLSGDFQQDVVAIRTTAGSDSVSVTFAGIPYLNRVKLDLKADVQADLVRKSYTLKDTELKLNDLLLAASGSATAAGEDLALDLAFGAPSTEFRHILSLVPAVYTRDFQSVKTAGKIAVAGKVKGNYGENAFPSFALDVKVDNGAFQYPDLPLPARDIFMDLNLANPGGDADSTVVSLKRFHVVIGRDPVNAELVLRTPISDPDVDLKVAGRLDLANVRKTMKLEGIDELSGTVAADAAVRTRMSYIDKKQYDRIGAQGSVNVGNLAVKGQGLPQPLSIKEASLRLSPQQAELRSFTGSIGSSDLQASGSLENLIGFALRDSVLRGNATVRSNKFNLNEWQSGEGELEVIPVPANIDFGLDATVNELTYAKLKMSNARGRLRVKDQRVTLENFRLNALGGEIGVTGFYETTTPAKPTFDVGLKMVKLDIPSAFTALTTVQMLAPVAKYARGNFTTDLKISGGLGKDMMPLFNGLNGNGSLQTSQMVLQDFPALEKLVDVTKLQFLDNPTMRSLSTAFRIKDGRLHVNPFSVNLGPTTMSVSGSNGLDQSLQYALKLRVPRSELGQAANQAVSGLISRAGAAGFDIKTASEIDLGIQLGGTVTQPAVKVDAASAVGSVKETLTDAVKEGVEKKVDSAAMKLVAEAEQRAEGIRKEARALAETTKKQGYAQADALEKKSTNPLLQAAAKAAADRLRKESDAKAAGIVREGDVQANGLVAEARKKAAVSP